MTNFYELTSADPVTPGTSELEFTPLYQPPGTSQEPHYPQTAAEIAAGVTPLVTKYEPGDVRRYGAVGDGVTDDYAAFNAAILQNHESDGVPILSHQAEYYISTMLEWCPNGESNKTWVANNTILQTDASINDITILKAGVFGVNDECYTLEIRGYLEVRNTTADATDSSNPGIHFGMIYMGFFNLGAKHFNTGIKCNPNYSGGFVHNQIFLGFMEDNNLGVWLAPEYTGWCNENTFYGGRFSFFQTGLQWHIYMPDSGHRSGRPNNNTFFRPSLEQTAATSEGWYFDGGSGNTLLHPRAEASSGANQNVAKIYLAESCLRYRIEGGLYVTSGDQKGSFVEPWVKNNGTNGVLLTPDQLFISPQRSGGAEVVQLIRTGANPTDIPLPVVDVKDMYSGSREPQVYRSVITSETSRDQTVGAYHFLAQSGGNIVSHIPNQPSSPTWVSGTTYALGDWVTASGQIYRCNKVPIPSAPSTTAPAIPNADTPEGYFWENQEGHYYECILTHDPIDADTEPMVGVDWRDYWEPLYASQPNSVFGAPNSSPWDSGAGSYAGRTTSFKVKGDGAIWTNQATGTATVGAQLDRMPIYDEAGTLIGYIPIYAAS